MQTTATLTEGEYYKLIAKARTCEVLRLEIDAKVRELRLAEAVQRATFDAIAGTYELDPAGEYLFHDDTLMLTARTGTGPAR